VTYTPLCSSQPVSRHKLLQVSIITSSSVRHRVTDYRVTTADLGTSNNDNSQ